jgi:cytochrome b5
MAGGKVYTFDDVRKHNERNDCWLIISGKVSPLHAYGCASTSVP